MKRPVRARAGQRIDQALLAIKLFEKRKADWDATELGVAIGISTQQARNLIATLTVRSLLEYAEVVVKRRRLVLTTVGKSPAARAA